jgi:hypothetical protein
MEIPLTGTQARSVSVWESRLNTPADLLYSALTAVKSSATGTEAHGRPTLISRHASPYHVVSLVKREYLALSTII